MSEHFAKVQKIALEAYNAKMNTPAVQAEVVRAHKEIEKAAEKGEFRCTFRLLVGEADVSYVRQVLRDEGYDVETQSESFFSIRWRVQNKK